MPSWHGINLQMHGPYVYPPPPQPHFVLFVTNHRHSLFVITCVFVTRFSRPQPSPDFALPKHHLSLPASFLSSHYISTIGLAKQLFYTLNKRIGDLLCNTLITYMFFFLPCASPFPAEYLISHVLTLSRYCYFLFIVLPSPERWAQKDGHPWSFQGLFSPLVILLSLSPWEPNSSPVQVAPVHRNISSFSLFLLFFP